MDVRAAWCGEVLSVGGEYYVGDDGKISSGSAGCAPEEIGGLSPDGLWSASVDTSGVVATLVARTGGGRSWSISNAAEPKWSPQNGPLALLGNLCAGFDLFVFDPTTGVLRNLTPDDDAVIVEYAWRPDGVALAVDLIPGADASPRRAIGLVQLDGGAMTTLLEIDREGELIPVGFNQSGTRLLFTYNPGRGFCDGSEPLPRPVTTLTETTRP
ncbi:MAG: hypothetical protein WEC75_13275 [Dehalococcoidia bacterium]